MTIVDAIRDLILTFTPVTAMVADRIYNTKLPQSPVLPALRLQRIDALEDTHLRGPGSVIRARIQVDSVALSGVTADALDVAVNGDGMSTGLRGWHGVVSGSPGVQILLIKPITVRSGYDPEELRQYKVMRDFWAWFRTA